MPEIHGCPLIPGAAEGPVIFTEEPLSFWGGYNARDGKIIDIHHALYGTNAAGKILVLPGARGSSTGSGILLEAIRLGTAPLAIILQRADAILALGALVGRELYHKSLPLVVVSAADFMLLREANYLTVTEAGFIYWQRTGS